jgi:hypothetical protein
MAAEERTRSGTPAGRVGTSWFLFFLVFEQKPKNQKTPDEQKPREKPKNHEKNHKNGEFPGDRGRFLGVVYLKPSFM